MEILIQFISWSIIQLFKIVYYFVILTSKKEEYLKYKPRINCDNKNLAFNIPCHGMGHISRARLLIELIEKNTKHKVKLVFFEKNGKSNIPFQFLNKLKDDGVTIFFLESCGFVYSIYGVDYIRTFISAVRKSYQVWKEQIFREKMYNYHQIDLILDIFDINSIISRNVIQSIIPIKYFFGAGRSKTDNSVNNLDTFISEILFSLIREKDNIYFQYPFQDLYISGNKASTIPLYRLNCISKQFTNKGNIIVCYFLLNSYIKLLQPFFLLFPKYTFYCFSYIKEDYNYRNIKARKVSDKFKEIFIISKGIISNSGSNLPIEAVYSKKPILLIPTHLEQRNIANQYCKLFNGMFSILGDKKDIANKIQKFIEYIENGNKNRYLLECDLALKRRTEINEIIKNIL
jgi:hypothetical protein